MKLCTICENKMFEVDCQIVTREFVEDHRTLMNYLEHRVGAIIQITNPEHEWYPALLVVSELKSFGCQAYIKIPMEDGLAYLRLKTSDYEVVGKARIVST